jgi:hypothetical protein
MNEAVLKLKDKILDEILADLDDHESEKLRPKAAVMEISAEKPTLEDGQGDDDTRPSDADPMAALGGKGDEDDELSDDDLKALLSQYRG